MTMQLSLTHDRFDLAALSKSICASSNFRFAWQFYEYYAPNHESPDSIRTALDLIATDASLHEFLRSSLDDIYPRDFEIEPLHEHATIKQDGSCFLDTVTRASLDRLGAYSRNLASSTAAERESVHQLFASIGKYYAFNTEPGSQAGCDICKHHNNDLISNWHYDVAWDYTFILTWPHASILWLGCLTDTD